MTEQDVGGTVVSGDDATAIRALLARMYDAWADGDAEAYGQCEALRRDDLLLSSIALVHTEASGRKKSYQTYVLAKVDAAIYSI